MNSCRNANITRTKERCITRKAVAIIHRNAGYGESRPATKRSAIEASDVYLDVGITGASVIPSVYKTNGSRSRSASW